MFKNEQHRNSKFDSYTEWEKGVILCWREKISVAPTLTKPQL